jgi:serine/threonine-protein kinase
MSAAAPTVINGRYELQRRLAQGGMAEVWLAIDLTLDRKVAVKWLKPTLATDPIVAERFRREAKAAASLNHSNIVAVHDVFEEDGRQAVVMQLVDGKSLRQLLDTQTRLSPELTCHIGIAVAGALHHAHQAGFVHRDVKPGNIMITPDGRVLLTDFGIAKGLHGEASEDLTSDNIMMGTAKYLSPEQVRGRKLDGRADLYSLGLVLYECLAGRVPFLGETDADTALARLQRDPTDLARLRATLPTRLVTTIHQVLARNPDHRPATGAELAAELKLARAEGPPHVDPTDEARSPVAPFAAGRLVRAPSDLRGRSVDRRRGSRTPTPPRGRAAGRPNRQRSRTGEHVRPAPPPAAVQRDRPRPTPPLATGAIPGEPHITGRLPVTDAGAPTTSVAAPRDRTPPAGTELRGAPARGVHQRNGPPLVVLGALLATATIVAIILWAVLVYGGGGDAAPTATLLPGETVEDPDADRETTEANGAGSADVAADVAGAGIATVTAYDPDGDDATENPDLARLAVDGDPATAWRTVCYSDTYMGAKRGVGLVVTLDGPVQRPLVVTVGNGPYQIEVFATADPAIPASFDAWGAPFDDAFGEDAATFEVIAPPAPATHVLVLLNQIGPDPGCSEANPYRGSLGEIALAG